MKVRKKAALLLATYMLSFYLYKKNSEITYELNDEYISEDVLPYAKYKDKNIYIGSKNMIYKTIGSDKNGIYIIDERNDDDPNMRICNSYKIKSLKDMKEILTMLLEYEEKNPSPWNRTYISMMIEWIIHTLSYYIGYEEESSRSVDLNNEDEDISWLIVRDKKRT